MMESCTKHEENVAAGYDEGVGMSVPHIERYRTRHQRTLRLWYVSPLVATAMRTRHCLPRTYLRVIGLAYIYGGLHSNGLL